jgi:hypothetical protein
MGQAKVKRTTAHVGNITVTKGGHIGISDDAPPLGNTGGKGESPNAESGNRSVTDRFRVNISVPDGIYSALVGISEKTGMSISQAALSALVAGLPALADQVGAVEALRL